MEYRYGRRDFFFFFSSRRRHTRFDCDWSSDVCSSDLIWVYAQTWGWWYALGFVLLMFVHECGHLLAARRIGLKVGAPVFIPFMGAFIALKEAPPNAWIEAQVGIGGPLLGTAGAAACDGLYLATGNPLFRALAFSGFFLNLFNLAPIGFLDRGRVVTALSPWLWLGGDVGLRRAPVHAFQLSA